MINRRIFAASLGAWTLAACTAQNPHKPATATPQPQPQLLLPDAGEPFPIEPVDLSTIDRQFWRQMVDNPTAEPAGTIVVDPYRNFLWLVMENGRAMRYGVGVGRDGFAWNGTATIARKAAWPKWTPPREMIEREPHLKRWAKGMPGGPENPLGARALYLFQNGKDTLYRLHGTSEPWSIGRAVSSGCIRLLNVDAMDLYRRTPVGTRVVVRPAAGGAATV